MSARHPLPRLWLMTDERMGDALFDAIERLPRGSGIVFRHYGLAAAERRALFRRAMRLARRKGHMLLLAGSAVRAKAWGADGSHGKGPGIGLRSAPAHDLAEIRDAERSGADLIFLSPVFPTRSHPGAPSLGLSRFARLVRRARLPVVALGGMSAASGREARRRGAWGWAAIDSWSSEFQRRDGNSRSGRL